MLYLLYTTTWKSKLVCLWSLESTLYMPPSLKHKIKYRQLHKCSINGCIGCHYKKLLVSTGYGIQMLHSQMYIYIYITRDLIDSQNSQNSLGTTSTNLSSDENLNLCRPCTTIGADDVESLNDLAVNQNTSFVDV